VGYILLYGAVLYVACPREAPRQMRIYFVLIAMFANFHYGTLNYYIGQMLFSCLAALGIYRLYPARRKRLEPELQPATVNP
jgi:membrane protein YqaA with SNARE-associated domain